METPKRVKDITGQRFGRVTVLEYVGNNKHRRARWLCRCDCGTVFVTDGENLAQGATRSCGCYRREVAMKNSVKTGILVSYPVTATSISGVTHYPSIAQAARAIGCAYATVQNYLASGLPFEGIIFTRNK